METNPTILIVDDEADIRELLSETLRPAGFRLLTASCGREAKQWLANEPIDLVITDIVMPDVNGLSLIMEIVKAHGTVKIIAISGGGGIHGRYDYLAISKLVGVKKIFRKPFSPNEIKQSVIELLNE